MSKVNFKSYQRTEPRGSLPSELQLVVAQFGAFLTLQETAVCLHKSYPTVYGLVRGGAIKSSRDKKRGAYRVSAAEIVRYMDKHKVIA